MARIMSFQKELGITNLHILNAAIDLLYTIDGQRDDLLASNIARQLEHLRYDEYSDDIPWDAMAGAFINEVFDD